MSVALTSGAARSLFASLNDAKAVEADLAHGLIVQLVDFKPLAEGTPKEKYRVTLSDGVASARAMLAPKFNELCKDGSLREKAVVKVTGASCVLLSTEARIIVISQLEIISPGGESYEQIGSPTLITSLAEDASTPAAAVDPQPPAPVAQPTAAVDSPAGGAADVPMPNAQGCAEANAAPACALVDGIAMPGATVDAADAEPKIEPKAEPTAEPTAEPKVEPKAEPTAEPVTEPVAEPTAEVATGAVAEAAGCAEAGLKREAVAATAPEAGAAPAEPAPPPTPSQPAATPMDVDDGRATCAESPPKAAAPIDAVAGTLDATPVQKRPRESDAAGELLSGGVVHELYTGAGNASAISAVLAKKPTVQIIEMRRIDGTTEKYRLTLSDGTHHMNALVHPRLNAELKGVQTLGTIKVLSGVCNIVSGRRVVIINKIEVLSAAPLAAGRLGSSVDVERAACGLGEMKTPSPHGAAGGGPLGADRALAAGRVKPISTLNPYGTGWAIKGRLTLLEEPRSFSRGDRAGRVMTVQIADESDEIRATLWAEAVDAYLPILQEGGVYLIASPKASAIKIANKRFSSLKNPYELSLGADARIVRFEEEEGGARGRASVQALLDIVPIAQLGAKPAQAAVDVVGVVLEVGALQRITRKNGDELTKRTLLLADESGASVELSLWDAHASKVDEAMAPGGSAAGADGVTVVCVKGARVSEWNTKSLATGRSSQLGVNPERAEADAVRAWWAARGGAGAAGLSALSVNERAGGAGGPGGAGGLPSERLELAQITLDAPQMLLASGAGKPLYATCRLWVQKLQTGENRPLWYAACPKCSRKLHGDEAAGWSCEACSTSMADADFRFILSAVACDRSGRQWLSLFNETGIKLLGQKAADLKALREVDEHGFDAALAARNWAGPFCARLRAKSEVWNGEAKLRINALDLAPCDFAAEAAAMLADIKRVQL
ncbi:hypothetical protein KFE25_002458 [Diacronema lutheri]|uniref:Replication protein A subunit n=1 Tax=Diacronema lutheri TaxID=2081491 RepID=A0A8J5XIG4_DIALT|nr:hypothetical protein KFE25_002458 [Diacronema lutheri]